MTYIREYRPAEKIIDCEKINEICENIEKICIPIEGRANLIYNELVNNTYNQDAVKLLDGLEKEIVDVGYTSAKELSNAVWLRFRHFGIGGSDAASIMGTSKWRTRLDLFYDKRGEKKAEKISEGQQYLFEFGHAMEAFVAQEFERRFMSKYRENFELQFSMKYGKVIKIENCRVFRDTFMYRNPDYQFMIADLDFVVEFDLSNGETMRGIFECKTTSPFTIADGWKDAAPEYYQVQINHYMTVMDYDFSVIACAADNSAANYYAHLVFRDDNFVSKLVKEEAKFWSDVKNNRPPYEEGVNNLQTIANQVNKNTDEVLKLENQYVFDKLDEYESLTAQIKTYDSMVSSLKDKRDVVASDIAILMGKANIPKATTEKDGKLWTIEMTEKVSSTTDYNKFFRELKRSHPEIADEVDELKKGCLKDPTPKVKCTIKSKRINSAKKKIA